MSDFGFSDSPLERVRALLATALDPNRPAEERRRAFETLQGLSDDLLKKLSMDSEWRHVMSLLEGDAEGKLSGDGPWSSSSDSEWTPPPAPSTSPAAGPSAGILDTYAQDLRWLVRDDFRSEPLLVPSRPEGRPTAIGRVTLGAAASPSRLVADERIIRRLPWGLMNHGAYLLTLWETWPERKDLLRVYVEESLAGHADLGIPPRLAIRLEDLLATSANGRTWFESAVSWIDGYAEAEILDFLSVEELAERHLQIRMEVARRVRQAEITDAGLVSGTEMYGTLRVLRTAASRDLVRAWHDAEGGIEATVRRYDEMNRSNELFFDQVFRAVLRQPERQDVQEMSNGDRQAAAMARAVRRRGVEGAGFLRHGEQLG